MTDSPTPAETARLQLQVGLWPYDHTRSLINGTTPIEGVDAQFHEHHIVSDIFEQMIRHHAYGVSELGLTFYLRTLEADEPPFIAIPVFPNRHFRHSAIYVNADSGIETPHDLIGKTIGEFATYGHDAGIWPKGILADEYGVTPNQCRWVIGGTDWYMPPFDFIPFKHPADVDVSLTAPGQQLGAMLEAGEIDALITAVVPQAVMNGSPNVRQLFPDYVSAERDYYARTGIYPMMHTVVIRRDLLREHPELARRTFDAFIASRDVALQSYERGRFEHQMGTMLPWFDTFYEDTRSVLKQDWWPYGVTANRTAVDTFLRYSFEQGVADRRWAVEDIFVTDLLDT